MKRAITLLMILFKIYSVSKAQELLDEDESIRLRADYNRGINAYVIVPSFTFGPSANINNDLLINGYPPFPRAQLNFGFGLNYRINRFVMMIDLFSRSQVIDSEDIDYSRLRSSQFTSNLILAYHVFKNEIVSIYPFIGYRVTDKSFFLTSRTDEINLDDILRNPGNSVLLNHTSEGLLLGVGCDLVNLFKSESPIITLRVGKRIQVTDAESWKSRFTPILNSPVDSFNYWQIQLSIGGAFNWDRKRH